MRNQGAYSYKQSNISTADRGKLVIMIYDHCLKWCKIALDANSIQNIEKTTQAIFKVQDGITELICALDMDKKNEISNNLFNLYTFYNKHLTTALQTKDPQPIEDVQKMMSTLRLAWLEAIEKVRVEDRSTLKESSGNQIRMVG